MKISKDKFDIFLVSIGISTILFSLALFTIYILLRKRKSNVEIKKNKADRPLWISFTIIAGSIWILSSFQLYGCLEWSSPDRFVCSFLKQGLQYTFGLYLWIIAILYRLIRMFMSGILLMSRPWRPVILNFMLLLPAVVLYLISFGNNEMYPATASLPYNEICMQDPPWTILYSVVSAIYLIIYIVFAGLDFRFLRKGGVLIWFAGFCLFSSFIFVVFDTVINLYDQASRLYHQILMLLVILTVFIHNILVFRFSMTTRKEESPKNVPEFEMEYGLLQLDREASPLPSLAKYPPQVQDKLSIDQKEIKEDPKEQGKEKADKQKENFIIRILAKYFRLKQDKISMDDDLEEEKRIDSHYYIPSEGLLFIPKPRIGQKYDEKYLYREDFKPVDLGRINDIIELQSNNSTDHNQVPTEGADKVLPRLALLKKYFPD